MNIEQIDAYLTMHGDLSIGAPWPEEESARRELAKVGPDLTPQLLERTRVKLAGFAEGLNNAIMGWLFETMIDQTYTRTVDLLIALIALNPQGGQRVASYLQSELEDRASVGRRALAALLCGVKGMPYPMVANAVTKHFDYDVANVVICCAPFVAGVEASISRQHRLQARASIATYIQNHPMLSDRYSGPADDEGRFVVYLLLLYRFLPKVIAATLYTETHG